MQNERLVEADRLKDEFVALISHDLRTPLTSIIGYIELALGRPEPPSTRSAAGYLEVVSRTRSACSRLVDDLLFVARLQAGGSSSSARARLCRDRGAGGRGGAAASRRQGASRSRSAAAPPSRSRRQGTDLPAARQPDLERDQVHAGGRPRRRPGRDGGTGAVLEVSDTGIGLAPGEAELVFDRFFRSSRSCAADSRHRPRPLHRARDRRGARRNDRRLAETAAARPSASSCRRARRSVEPTAELVA